MSGQNKQVNDIQEQKITDIGGKLATDLCKFSNDNTVFDQVIKRTLQITTIGPNLS